jgi:hypothetical protein
MYRRIASAAFLALVLAALGSACGSGDAGVTPTGTPTPPAPAAPAGRATPPPDTTSATPLPSPDGSATSSDTPAAATATISVPPDRERVLAPIDAADIVVRESSPPQYAVHLVSGLPNGCTLFAGITTARAGDEITITVENSVPRDKNIACTQIYGTREATVDLGSDFTPGTTYTVRVNDRTLTFTAE